jgi:hydrogenase maturation protease
MTKDRVLIAGVGNIFHGDDAFGVEVLRRLSMRKLPEGVKAVDFGIRGLDLAYALLDRYEATILVDATSRGGAPGTVYTIQPDLNDLGSEDVNSRGIEAHGMNPMRVLRMVKAMGGEPQQVFLVGCEPQTLGPDEGLMGLSAIVEAAIDPAIEMIESLAGRLLAGKRIMESAAIDRGGHN